MLCYNIFMEYKRIFTYGRRNLNPKFENHWEEVDIKNFRVKKPLVLLLGGSGTLSDEASNGNVKIVETFLGVFNQDVDLLGVTYNHAFTDEEQMASVDEIVANIFVPILTKNGKRLTLQSALKKMRNITIFAHCYGDFKILTMLVNKLNEQMTKLKYSADEIKKITKQIFVVSYGTNPRQKIERDIKSFTVISASDEYWLDPELDTLRMLDAKDVKISKKDRQKFENLSKDAAGELRSYKFYEENERCFIFAENEDNIRVATGMLHKKDDGDHSFGELKRQEDWKIGEKASKTGDYVSRCLACALCHSVANSILNNKSKKFVEIDMADLRAELENIVKPLNFEEPEIII